MKSWLIPVNNPSCFISSKKTLSEEKFRGVQEQKLTTEHQKKETLNY